MTTTSTRWTDLSLQSAGQPVIVITSLETVHNAGSASAGVINERIQLWAHNIGTAEAKLTLTITGTWDAFVVKLRPQAGPVQILYDLRLPPDSGFIAAKADIADVVHLTGSVIQYLEEEV